MPSMLTRESFEQIVAKIKNVPTLPEAVSQICRLVNDPQASTKKLRDLVKKDGAMAAKMLRMVNSVFYGVQEPVHDL
jgi:HD-like signal output (HDOD) protein